VAKLRAPELLRRALERRTWTGEPIAFSGNTDAWQPLEASLRLTRGCLEVCAEYRNPVLVTTKAPLVERDIDLLSSLAGHGAASVTITLPFLDPARARAMEPWVASPERRLETIRRIAAAGIPVGVSLAPIIPGLNDEEIPRVLAAAREAGATRAHWLLLRLPGPVKEVFEERLRAALPERADRVLHRIRETRDGKLYDGRFGVRGRGEGEYAATIGALFDAAASRLGFASCNRPPSAPFRRPRAQLALFPGA